MTESMKQLPVAVIGAGPAGLYAARELAAAGMKVALINRDIKLGGLAEYGIYHDKHKMKNGLRKQFHKLMQAPNICYYGNVAIGEGQDLSLADLQAMGFAAVMVTVGAQGTKWLGLEGEDLKGVYHAKDIVYHYNQLPPFSQQEFAIGKRVALIGVGNVMLDIAHWAIRDLKVDEVIAVARRGPADVKFTKPELGHVAANLDLDSIRKEIERARESMENVGQDPEAAYAFIASGLEKADPKISDTVFRMEFLASPNRIVGENGQVTGLEVEDTKLEPKGENDSRAVSLGTTRVIPTDTVVFCIGDRVDSSLGLPLDKWGEFAKSPEPRFPVQETSYEAYDPESSKTVEGVFLAGWAREASSGLVGTARKDGENGAKAMLDYLATLNNGHDMDAAFGALEARLSGLGTPIISKEDWLKLVEVETGIAEERGLELFKYDSNAEMLQAIGK